MRLILFLLLLCGCILPVTAEVYKWADAKGNVQYSDTPPPPKEAKNVEQKKLNGNLVESDSMTYEGKLAAQKNPITLYFFEPCGDPCAKAQSLLEKRGVPYTLKNQEQDKLELKNLTGDTQMPVLVVGTLSPSQGFEEGHGIACWIRPAIPRAILWQSFTKQRQNLYRRRPKLNSG